MYNNEINMSDDTRKNHSQESFNFFLDDTQKIMESIEAGIEKASLLKEDVTNNESMYKKLKSMTQMLKGSLNENLTDLKNQINVSDEMKKDNAKFMLMAQALYSSTLELRNAIAAEANHELTFDKHEVKYNAKIEEYDQQIIQLKKSIEETRKINCKTEENKQTLLKKSEELKVQLYNFNNEISLTEEKLKFHRDSINNQDNLDEEIKILKEETKKVTDEILLSTESLQSTEEQKQNETELIIKNITETDKKIVDVQIEVNETLVILEKSESEKKMSDEILLNLQNDIKSSEYDIKNLKYYLEETNKLFRDTRERFNREVFSHKEAITKNERYLQINKGIGDKLLEKLEIKKADEKSLDSELETLTADVNDLENRSKFNLNKELEIKEEQLQELKISSKSKKEEYQRRIDEKKEEIQLVIANTESNNKKIQEFNENLTKDIDDIKKTIEQMKKEKNELEDLQISLSLTPTPTKKVRRWGSDSTIHEEEPVKRYLEKDESVTSYLKKLRLLGLKK